jgi:hypothetical protein
MILWSGLSVRGEQDSLADSLNYRDLLALQARRTQSRDPKGLPTWLTDHRAQPECVAITSQRITRIPTRSVKLRWGSNRGVPTLHE